MTYQPRAYALEGNKGPAVLAGLILLGGYVVGPLAGHLLYRAATRIGATHVEFTTEGDTA